MKESKVYQCCRKKLPLFIKDRRSVWNTGPLRDNLENRNDPYLFLTFQVRGIASSLCGVLNDNNFDWFGNRCSSTSQHEIQSSCAIISSVNPHPPDYPVCKEYLDFYTKVVLIMSGFHHLGAM